MDLVLTITIPEASKQDVLNSYGFPMGRIVSVSGLQPEISNIDDLLVDRITTDIQSRINAPKIALQQAQIRQAAEEAIKNAQPIDTPKVTCCITQTAQPAMEKVG